jgi:hypothetical protein
MPERERRKRRRRHPEWARRERASDLAWIRENLDVLWPAAEQAYEDVGRGAIVVDTTQRPTGQGHPFGYFPQEDLQKYEDEDINRMMEEYDPSWEMVTVLLKPQNRTSTYRVGVARPDSET